jgi:hypothetical protein
MPKKSSVEKNTLELIKTLQQKEYLKGFYLVGGTALALHLNHRKSIDIDLFSNFNFDASQLLEKLTTDFQFQLFLSSSNTLQGAIKKVKVDIMAHRYPLLHDPSSIDGIHTVSLEDIIAMKLNAISISGQRIKDFIDIYCLLDRYSIDDMIDFYQKKYNQKNQLNVLKSLIYFDDVDNADWPMMVEPKNLKWAQVKKTLTQRVIQFSKKSI